MKMDGIESLTGDPQGFDNSLEGEAQSSPPCPKLRSPCPLAPPRPDPVCPEW